MDDIVRLTIQHLMLSGVSLVVAVLFAVPIGIWAHGRPERIRLVTGLTGVLYTIPSLALFSLLIPVIGLGRTPVIIGLVAYAQLILVRSVIDALDSVPEPVRDAAIGMGIPRLQILRKVDIPLAMPVFVSGLRITTVTLIGIATVGGLVDAGGLGELILNGIQRDFTTQVITGAVAVSILALAADFTLSRIEKSFTRYAS